MSPSYPPSGGNALAYNFMYFYRVTNILNGKAYYGIHRTDRLNDGYLGSGTALLQAKEKHGQDAFRKEILEFFDEEKELLDFERLIVDEDWVRRKDTYNLVVGGQQANYTAYVSFWKTEEGKKLREGLRKAYSGYSNPDFVKRWKPLYDYVAPSFVNSVVNTNLPDFLIIRSLPCSKRLKFHRLLNYCLHMGLVDDVVERVRFQDHFSGSYAPNTFVKTVCTSRQQRAITTFKALDPAALTLYESVMSAVHDETLSDSMLYNDRVGIPNSRTFGALLRYYEYLGLVRCVGTSEVDIRKRLPASQRANGRKTVYRENETFTQNYRLIIVEEGVGANYQLFHDGGRVCYRGC